MTAGDAVALVATDSETRRLTGSRRTFSLDELQAWYRTRADHDDGLNLLLPPLHVGSLDPVRNLWRRAGLVDVMAEELCGLDRIERLEMPEDQRRVWQDHVWYLVEGIRPDR